MSKKDSTKFSTNCIKPNLAVLFEKSQKEIYNEKVYVPTSKYAIFSTFSDDLRQNGVGDKDYTDTTVRLLKSWLKQKNFKTIPIPVFCGDWCFQRYLKISTSESVTIKKESLYDELIYSETMVARYYITKNLEGVFRYSSAVLDLERLLSKTWLKLYEEELLPSKFRYIVVDELSEEFGVKNCRNYNDIIGKLLCN